MKNLKDSYYNPFFSHIYIEKEVIAYPRAERILEKFPNAVVVEIEHYKDVFCRSSQNYIIQHKSQSLIIAAKKGDLIYEGAPVCQSFGNEYFYYTSCMMNCVYNCEYCYLKGMYPSGNVVVFVNIEDIFEEISRIISIHPVYLCVSYDTDMMAMDYITGYTAEWVSFAENHDNLKIEIRTKSANIKLIEKLKPCPNVIYAFTLSPQSVIAAYEHKTPSLQERLKCVSKAVEMGFKVRLCFDPMIYFPEWERHYDMMLNDIYSNIEMEKIEDISVGSFRISQDYIKKMRKNEPYSPIVQFPYQNDNGFYHYPDEIMNSMEKHMVLRLKEKISENKIFLWRE